MHSEVVSHLVGDDEGGSEPDVLVDVAAADRTAHPVDIGDAERSTGRVAVGANVVAECQMSERRNAKMVSE